MIWREHFATQDSFLIPEVQQYPAVNVYEATTDVKPANWNSNYSQILSDLPAGVSVLIVHLAIDNAETRAMTENHDYYDSKSFDIISKCAVIESIKSINRSKSSSCLNHSLLETIFLMSV